jgi:flagellin
MVQRINELAIQAASGVKTDDDRAAIQDEIKELKEELDRMMEDTEFNGKKLLNGDCDLKGYSDVDGVTAGYYSDEVPIGKYSFSVTQPLPRDAEGNIDLQEGDVTLLMDGSETAFPTDAMVSCYGDKVTVKAAGEFEVQFYMSDAYDAAGTSDITLDLTGMGAMRVQIGANEGQAIEIRIPEVSLKTMGLTDIDLSTTEGAQEAIELSKQANTFISSIRSRIGAYENRLEHTGNSIDISEENMTAAFSRLMDTDMAEEMTEYTNQQVLNQAGISILTQANQRPSEMLQLLQ